MSIGSSASSGDLNLSPTIAGVVNTLSPKDEVFSAEIVIEILNRHGEYGRNKSAAARSVLVEFMDQKNGSKGEMRPVNDWFSRVAEFFHLTKSDQLHGHLVIIGLAMLSPELKTVLDENNFLADVVTELQDPLEGLLSDLGLSTYRDVFKPPGAKVNEYLENKDDNPVADPNNDFLDRNAFAVFLVKLLNNISLDKGAYAMHLYAPWGAGKTSFMNFMKAELEKEKTAEGKRRWYAIDFNAWENQSLAYPWWTLMNNIFRRFKNEMKFSVKLKEWGWRFRFVRLHQFISIVLILCLLYFIFGPQGGLDKAGVSMDAVGKILASVVCLWGIFTALSQSFFLRSPKSAQNYLDSKDNPMADFKAKFSGLLKSIAPSNLIIFIDDLDRCKSAYVVELLENVQSLFKEAKVIFVVAADIKWLNACYEVEYEPIKSYVSMEGKTIGPLFTEKMFQLSVALPGVPKEIKDKFWNTMLGISPAAPGTQDNIKEEPGPSGEKKFEIEHTLKIAELNKLAETSSLVQTEHVLKNYNIFLDLNPRNMKRLLNAYIVNKGSSLVSHIELPSHQLILWTILSIQWPVLASFLLKHPGLLDQPGELFPDVPENILYLLKTDEVQTVLMSTGLGTPLSVETLSKCRILFGSSTYYPAIYHGQKVTPAPSPQ